MIMAVVTLAINVLIVSFIKVLKKDYSEKLPLIYEYFWAGIFTAIIATLTSALSKEHGFTIIINSIINVTDAHFFALVLIGLINLAILLLMSYLFKSVSFKILIFILQLQLTLLALGYGLLTQSLQPIYLVSFTLIFIGSILPIIEKKRLKVVIIFAYALGILISVLKVLHRFIQYTYSTYHAKTQLFDPTTYTTKESIFHAAMANPIDFEIELIVVTSLIIFIYLIINKERRNLIFPKLKEHWISVLALTAFYLLARFTYLHIYEKVDDTFQLKMLISLTTPTTLILTWIILKEKIDTLHVISVALILSGTLLALLFG